MQFASWKERKAIAGALKPIYRADHADAAWQALEAFDEGPWGQKYPAIAQSWRRNWEAVIPFFAFPTDVRKIIYTTNAIESLSASVRKELTGSLYTSSTSREEATEREGAADSEISKPDSERLETDPTPRGVRKAGCRHSA